MNKKKLAVLIIVGTASLALLIASIVCACKGIWDCGIYCLIWAMWLSQKSDNYNRNQE